MKLKIKRDQKTTGMIGKKIVFNLSATIVLAEEEAELAEKYKLDNTTIYFDKEKSIAYKVNGLTKGASFECKDILEAGEIEDEMTEACRNFKAFLDDSANFGGEEVLEF